MSNFELFKGMVNSTDLNRIFTIVAEEIFNAIPKDVMSEGMKGTIENATKVIIPVIVPIYKNSFLKVYEEEFTDDEFGKLFAYYGPGSTLWSFFNTNDFFPWLRQTIRVVIQKRIEGLELAAMSAEELQGLASVGLTELLDQLPEWVKVGAAGYIDSDLCSREATLGDRIAEEGNKAMAEIDWCDLLEKSGILPED